MYINKARSRRKLIPPSFKNVDFSDKKLINILWYVYFSKIEDQNLVYCNLATDSVLVEASFATSKTEFDI